MVRRVGQAVRNSNVGGICYKAPCSSLPQGRGSLRSSREQAWQLTGSWGLPAGVRPGLLGPLASAHPPSPLWPFSSSSLFLPLSFLFQPEDGPPDLVASFLFLSPPHSLSCWPLTSAWTDPALPLLPSSQALCAAVTTTDLAETQALLGCGAGVNCFSGDSEAPTPLALAAQAGQTLQMEFLRNNRTTGEWPVGSSTSRDGASLLLGSVPLQVGVRQGCVSPCEV